jgi:hypothetical protein
VNDRFIVIGNPANRRVTLFCGALRAQGLPAPHVFAHADLIPCPDRLLSLPDGPFHVRIEATGEDPAVEGLLLDRGHDAALSHQCETVPIGTRPPAGRLVAPRQHHLGFLAYLDDLEAVFAQRPQWRIWSPPALIRALFDKRVTSARMAAAGVPVPEPFPGIAQLRDLEAAIARQTRPRMVVKLACGSSASGLAVQHGRALMTTMRWLGDGWANAFKVQRIADPVARRRVLDWLLSEGAQVEHFVPKARFDGAYFDLRVLCVAGEPAFMVMRQARHPITNLHLGGWRGDVDRLQAAVPADAWDAAMESCRTAARLYPCHHLGVDLMFEPDLHGHRIIELNAFGDLLPRLERDGLDVYGWEIARRPTR